MKENKLSAFMQGMGSIFDIAPRSRLFDSEQDLLKLLDSPKDIEISFNENWEELTNEEAYFVIKKTKKIANDIQENNGFDKDCQALQTDWHNLGEDFHRAIKKTKYSIQKGVT